MNNRFFFAIYTCVIFFLGVITSYAFFYRQTAISTNQTNMSADNRSLPTPTTYALPTNQAIASSSNSKPIEIATQATTQKTFNTQQFSEESAKQLVNALPEAQLNHYVQRFMTAKDAELITDKRQFANRAVEELYKSNDNQPMIGQIVLSDSATMPSQSINTNSIAKTQKLFAHLNTFGKVPLGANVFVKWVNRNTGEVLLFEKKLIIPDSATNWVSYQPYDGWQAGSYDIRFYQFTSQLEPVAQISYDVNQVTD